MKKIVILLGLFGIILFAINQYVSAVTVGVEAPKSFMENLRLCKKGSFKEISQNSLVSEYEIMGLTPNGRCEFSRTTYSDFTNKDAYEGAISAYKGFYDMVASMAKQQNSFVPDMKLPSQDEMIKSALDEKDILICKLSKDEREALYQAWAKHDDKNPPAKYVNNGNRTEYSFSFSTDKMSSYDNLMMKYAQGPCSEDKDNAMKLNDKAPSSIKKYACEYADTTCYLTLYKYNGEQSEGASMSCTGDRESFGLIDRVKKHAKAGMCEVL